MSNFIIIPDSFKGTLSSIEVCDIIEQEIIKVFPDAHIDKIPVADGGEGSVDAFLKARPGRKVTTEVNGPYFNPITSFYGIIDDGETAVIEMAAAAGLPLVGDDKDPSKTTTFGFGELIRHALDQGVKRIVLGLGGSATNDGGCGFAAALGIQFLDENGKAFIPTGGTLNQIKKIDVSMRDPRIADIEIITMCDIDNPLYGLEGAAYVFSPQKGANPEMVKMLDQQLKHLAAVVERDLGFGDPMFKGAGAAGGMGYGAKVFLDSKIQMGIETVLDVMDFDRLAREADYIITGEGKLDDQSLRGKVVIGVARRSKHYKAQVIAVVGQMSGDLSSFNHEGIDHVIITNHLGLSFEALKPRAKTDMIYTVARFLKDLKGI